MNQNDIRPYNDETYSVEEGSEIIQELDARTKHDDSEYNSIASIGVKMKYVRENYGTRIANLESNQVTGVIQYPTLADLPTPGTSNASYKVTNDPTPSNNGFYSWNGSSYDKELDLYNGEVSEGETEAVSGTKIDAIRAEMYPYKKDILPLNPFTQKQKQDFVIDLYLEGTRDEARAYAVQRIRRNYNGEWSIRIANEILDPGNTPSTFTILAEFSTSINPENGDAVTVHELEEFSGSGVKGLIAVNWSKITEDENYVCWAGRGYEIEDTVFDIHNASYLNSKTQRLTKSFQRYPFEGTSEDLDSKVVLAIRDIKVYGYNGNNPLFIDRIDRENGLKWRINLREYNPSTGGSTLLCYVNERIFEEPDNTVHIYDSTTEVGSSGVSFRVWIDWSQLDVGQTDYEFKQTQLSKMVYKSKDSYRDVDLTNNRKSTYNAENLAFTNNIKNQDLVRLQPIIDGYNHFIIYGQSLAVGGGQALNTTPYKSIKMIGDNYWYNRTTDTGNLYDLIADAVNGDDNMLINGLRGFVDLADDVRISSIKTEFVMTAGGFGGTSLELLSKNNPVQDYYENHFLQSLIDLKSISDNEGKEVRCPAILFAQGEANMSENANQSWDGTGNATNDYDVYKEYLETLFDDMIADVKSVYGQTADPVILMYITRGLGGGVDMAIQRAQLDVANERQNIFVFTPTYALTTNSADKTHPTANGYNWMGDYATKALYNTIIKKKKFTWLQPRKIVLGINNVGGNYVDVHFNVPNPPLVANFETPADTVSENGINSLGFKVYDDGNDVTLKSVDVYDTFVRITLLENDKFITDNITITYGDDDNNGSGNLCDSDDFLAREKFVSGVTADDFTPNYIDGTSILNKPFPLYNWCVPFSYNLNGIKELIIDL